MTYVRLLRTNEAQSQDFGLRSEVRALSLLLDLAWRQWELLALAPGSWRMEPPQAKQEGASAPGDIVLVLNPFMLEARSSHDVDDTCFATASLGFESFQAGRLSDSGTVLLLGADPR